MRVWSDRSCGLGSRNANPWEIHGPASSPYTTLQCGMKDHRRSSRNIQRVGSNCSNEFGPLGYDNPPYDKPAEFIYLHDAGMVLCLNPRIKIFYDFEMRAYELNPLRDLLAQEVDFE